MRRMMTLPLLALLLTATAEGQEMELTLSGGRVADHQGTARTGVSVAPAVGWTDGLNAVTLRGSATLMDHGEPLLGAGLDTRLRLIGAGFAALELAAAGEVLGSDGWRAAGGRVSPRLSFSSLGWSASAGPLWGVAGQRVATEVPSGGLLPGQTRTEYSDSTRALSGVSLDARAVQGPASVAAGWTQLRTADHEWEDVSLVGSVVVQGLVLGASGGIRLGGDEASWAGASLAIPFDGGTTLLLEGGRFPSDLVLGRSGGRYLTAGLRIRGSGL